MSGRRGKRHWLAVGVVIVLAGSLASAVVASRIDDGSDLVAAIDEAPLTRVANIDAADGAAELGVFVQTTKTGHVCVWEAPTVTSRERGGGCNTADDPLNGGAVSATLSYDGGPAISSVRRATLFGLAAAKVARVAVLMTDGSPRTVKLKTTEIGSVEFQAFGHRFKKADLKSGIGPIAIVAFDANGVELGRQPTGIGG
ncbi:MAG: hypothetical protein ACRDPX_08865 [Gaiellaceae bacterium]